MPPYFLKKIILYHVLGHYITAIVRIDLYVRYISCLCLLLRQLADRLNTAINRCKSITHLLNCVEVYLFCLFFLCKSELVTRVLY
jgi:hypothetical protein